MRQRAPLRFASIQGAVWINVPELNIPRRTLMVHREEGYLSEPARELIKIVRGFNWKSDGVRRVAPIKRRA
jgi:hypothetical protein